MSESKPECNDFLTYLHEIGRLDADGLTEAQKSYGNSWKSRGGVGAFMMLARKWDRMHNILERDYGYDVFRAVVEDGRAEGVIDDIRDLRRYLMLVESELLAMGAVQINNHRDNSDEPNPAIKFINECPRHVFYNTGGGIFTCTKCSCKWDANAAGSPPMSMVGVPAGFDVTPIPGWTNQFLVPDDPETIKKINDSRSHAAS